VGSRLAVFRVSARMRGERLATWTLARMGDPLASLTQPLAQRDPYPVYEQIRRTGALSRSRTGLWVTCSHPLAVKLVRDRRFRVRNSEDRVRDGMGDLGPGLGDSLVDLEPPEHTRLRRLVAPAFGRGRIEAYRDRVERLAEKLLDNVAAVSGFDLVRDFASPFPIAIIADLLGVPDADAAQFARYGRIVTGLLDGVRSIPQARELRSTVRDLRTMFVGLIRQREAEPGDDLISSLIAADETLTDDEVATLCIQLLVAGFETTTHLIANGIAALLDHPEQWQALCADPDLAPAVVEETLRYDPPVQLTQRLAREPVELHGHQLRPGDQVIVGLAGANRDPDVFAEPHVFDVHRSDVGEHLGFSGGHHYCVGAPLARLEGDVAFRVLARRFPHLGLSAPAVRRSSTVLRGLLHLPVIAG
jgi:P450-derived glycosyltransferase activator